jgi:predicted ATP-dependent serine protease
MPFSRNPFFTGRDEVLSHLHTALAATSKAALTPLQAISGLGGIGKTQTAIEYAYRYRDDYQHVLWVRAETHETLVADLIAIAELLNLPEKSRQDQRITIKAVKRWLETHSEWLLIFDNATTLRW